MFSPELKSYRGSVKANWGTNELQIIGRYENWEQIATFCKKLFKKFKFFTKILKKIWKFSKSKNRKILKLVFGQKKYFYVLLRPNYIVFKNF